jgi:hypothetical protein
MARWFLTGEVTVSAFTYVEADTLEEAKTIAKDRDAELTFNGSGSDENETWLVEEVDGTVSFVGGEEAEEQ